MPRKKKYKKAKWLYEEDLQIAVKRREAKGKGEEERYMFCLFGLFFLPFGFLAAKHVGS